MHALRYWLAAWALLWLALAAALLSRGYEGSFLVINSWHSPWADQLMPHYTHLGDGLLLGAAGVLLLYRRDPALAVVLVLVLLGVGLAVWLGKFVIFRDWHRPIIVFLHREEFHYVALTRLFHYSFPSGHSAAVAAAGTVLAFAAGRSRPVWGLLLFVPAALAAYSRIYIGVHFPADMLAGSLLGVLLALAGLRWVADPAGRLLGKLPLVQPLLLGGGSAVLLAACVRLWLAYY
ncbi:MAG: hypothetical protein OHK0039_18080 [Bacteroidia bacterium]